MAELFPLNINEELFDVAVSDTDELRSKGLSGLKRVGVRKGMLFIFPEPIRMRMIMNEMEFGIDILFLDESWNVVQMGTLNPGADEIIADSPVSLVLELRKGIIGEVGIEIGTTIEPSEDLATHFAGVKRFKSGGKFEMIGDKVYEIKVDDVVLEQGKIQVLDTDGVIVANIDSGARIYSRDHTKELIKKFKSGDKLALADSVINILNIQDNQKQEFVKT